MTAGESGDGPEEEPPDSDSSPDSDPDDGSDGTGDTDERTDGPGSDGEDASGAETDETEADETETDETDETDAPGDDVDDGGDDGDRGEPDDWSSAEALPGDGLAGTTGLPGGTGSTGDDAGSSTESDEGAEPGGDDAEDLESEWLAEGHSREIPGQHDLDPTGEREASGVTVPDEDGVDAASDGGAVARSEAGFPDPEVDTGSTGVWSDGPEYDEEMPLADHIEEMVRRLGAVIVVMAFVSVLVLPVSDELINFIWYSILGQAQDDVSRPNVYQPLALVLARVKVATLAGFVLALPVFVYQTYLFMRPGLYPNERRYYLAAVPTSLVLATVGVAFAFYLVLPAIFIYFLYYSQEAALIAFGLSDTFGLMLLLMGFFAVVFQIPLFIMLAIMMGLTDREWLASRRLYFWGAFLGIAFLFSPDPTGMAPIIVAATMIGLFEGTLLLLRWTGRGKRRRRAAEAEEVPAEPDTGVEAAQEVPDSDVQRVGETGEEGVDDGEGSGDVGPDGRESADETDDEADDDDVGDDEGDEDVDDEGDDDVDEADDDDVDDEGDDDVDETGDEDADGEDGKN